MNLSSAESAQSGKVKKVYIIMNIFYSWIFISYLTIFLYIFHCMINMYIIPYHRHLLKEQWINWKITTYLYSCLISLLIVCLMLRWRLAKWLACFTVILKVAGSSPTQTTDWKSLCLPSSEWVPFGWRQQKVRNWAHLLYAVAYHPYNHKTFNGRPKMSYEGCSKWIAYFYLETSNFKLAQKYSFHALEVLPVARNAKFQPMYPLLEGVMVRWFGHSNKVLMNGRSKCLSGLISAQQGMLSISETKRNHMGQGLGNTGGKANSYFFFLQKRRNYCGGIAGALSCRRRTCLKPVAGRRFW